MKKKLLLPLVMILGILVFSTVVSANHLGTHIPGVDKVRKDRVKMQDFLEVKNSITRTKNLKSYDGGKNNYVGLVTNAYRRKHTGKDSVKWSGYVRRRGSGRAIAFRNIDVKKLGIDKLNIGDVVSYSIKRIGSYGFATNFKILN